MQEFTVQGVVISQRRGGCFFLFCLRRGAYLRGDTYARIYSTGSCDWSKERGVLFLILSEEGCSFEGRY